MTDDEAVAHVKRMRRFFAEVDAQEREEPYWFKKLQPCDNAVVATVLEQHISESNVLNRSLFLREIRHGSVQTRPPTYADPRDNPAAPYSPEGIEELSKQAPYILASLLKAREARRAVKPLDVACIQGVRVQF